jgi:hypothetical protein
MADEEISDAERDARLADHRNPEEAEAFVRKFTDTENPLSAKLKQFEDAGVDAKTRAVYLRGQLNNLTRKDGPSK